MKRVPHLRRLLPLLMLAATLQLSPGYYDPAAQRWINRDPIGESGGMNQHEFALNSPATSYDPDGQAPGTGGGTIGMGTPEYWEIIEWIGSEGGKQCIKQAAVSAAKIVIVSATVVSATIIVTGPNREKGECEFYASWCQWGNNRPPDDPGKGWKRNSPCGTCYQACKTTGKWPFAKCPIPGGGDPKGRGPAWPPGGKFPGGREPALPTPGVY